MRIKILFLMVVLFVVSAQARLWIRTKPAAAFTPASISGLRVWYDLSDLATITKNGSNIISAVADKSGNGYTGIGSGSLLYVANAKNGLSVAQFNGTNSQIRTTAGADLTTFSASLIAMPSSVVRYKILLGASVKPTGQLSFFEEFNSTDSALAIFGLPSAENTVTPQNSFVASNFYRLLWTYAGGIPGLNTIYINRVSSATGNIASGKLYTNDLTIGYDAGSNGWFGFAGQMGEVVIYDHVLSLGDQILLDNYLHDKWGFSDTPPDPTPVVFTPTAPKARQITQRNGSNTGTISIAGPSVSGTSARARAVVRSGYAGTTTSWQSLSVSGGNVTGTLTANAGFYDIEIEVYVISYLLSSTTVARFGIGDVFIGAGQSNGTNYYLPLDSTPANDAVNILSSSNTWSAAIDPVSVQDGSNLSSLWPALGDLIYAHTTFPVGFAVVGQANTFVADWVPVTGTYYPRITTALSRFGGNVRSVLWIQGENDAATSVSQSAYATALTTIKNQVQTDAGQAVPFGVAVTETHPNEATGAGVMAGQAQVAALSNSYTGANPDSLGNTYRYDTVHFNSTTGRSAHAGLWYAVLLANGLIP